ncbi:MAG: rhomboid family intramembrane serine protease [Herbinix sp.]|nr:rhomboid family intramembrane serine protease [Herbinix sp.]
MVEDRLNSSLTNMGYQRLASNAQGIYLYYCVLEKDLIIVSVIHALGGNEITEKQYGHILGQMKENFRNSYPHRIQLLSLVLTRYPDKVKRFCSTVGEDSHWIVDLSTFRLMIYETQSNDFAGFKGILEEILEEEQRQYTGEVSMDNSYGGQQNSDTLRKAKASKTLQFTLINTAIIVFNIIAYIITHYTNAFGGEEQMVTKGALSWYFVTENKEYYRLLTSMFMHADGSHLINNMMVLLFIGGNLERAVGKLKYLFIYFGTGIIAGITSISYNMWKENVILALGDTTFSIGASGAIFGVVGAILYIVMSNRGRFQQISIKQMVLFVVLSLYSGIINTHIDQAAHVGGFLAGLLLAAIVYRRAKNKEVNLFSD